jgi:hypothetical protein
MNNYKEPLITKKQPKLTETVIIPEEVIPPKVRRVKKVKMTYKEKVFAQESQKVKNSLILNLVLLFVFVGFLIFFITNCKENQVFSNTEPEPYERLLFV